MKDIFNVHWLDLQAVASSFCFSNPPKVNLNLDSSASMFRKNMHRVDGIRHGINPRNPYGRQNGGDDTRQFVRHQDIEASPCSSAVIFSTSFVFFLADGTNQNETKFFWGFPSFHSDLVTMETL